MWYEVRLGIISNGHFLSVEASSLNPQRLWRTEYCRTRVQLFFKCADDSVTKKEWRPVPISATGSAHTVHTMERDIAAAASSPKKSYSSAWIAKYYWGRLLCYQVEDTKSQRIELSSWYKTILVIYWLPLPHSPAILCDFQHTDSPATTDKAISLDWRVYMSHQEVVNSFMVSAKSHGQVN